MITTRSKRRQHGIFVQCLPAALGAALLGVAGGLFPQYAYWCVFSACICLVAAAAMAGAAFRDRLAALKSTMIKQRGDLLISLTLEQHAMHCVLTRFPQCTLPTTGWSMRFANLHAILRLLDEHRPKRIVEFGSGLSTIMIASWLAEQGEGELVSVDHDENWAHGTRREVARHGLSDVARVVHVALGPHTDQQIGQEVAWYADLSRHLPSGTIDFVVVDGPPANASVSRMSRFPALPVLHERLAPEAVLVLDDARRPAESAIVKKWAALFPDFAVRVLPTHSGLAVMQRNLESPRDARHEQPLTSGAASEHFHDE
jgi:predicted O-methyltransferase YrrM